MSISRCTYSGFVIWRKYSSLRMPDERVGRPSASSGPESSRKLYAASWLCVYSFSPLAAAISPSGSSARPRRPSRPCSCCRSGRRPCRGTAGRGCSRLLDVRHVRGHLRRIGEVARDAAVVADRDQPVVVEDLADLGGRDLPAEDRRVLVVARELDAVVADLGQALEHLGEAVRHAGRVRRRADAVADRVQDDAALARRHEHPAPAGRAVELEAAEDPGAGCGARRGPEEPAAVHAELSAHVHSSSSRPAPLPRPFPSRSDRPIPGATVHVLPPPRKQLLRCAGRKSVRPRRA